MTQSTPSAMHATAPEDPGAPSRRPAGRTRLDRYFHMSERGSTVAREPA
ncbi:hypothetical protein [Actinacidiphila sp. bgisy160]